MIRRFTVVGTFSLVLSLAGGVLGQTPVPSAPIAPAPRQDAITVEGCLTGDTLKVTKDDPTNLTGARTMHLVGTRTMRQRVREVRGHHVRATGVLALKRVQPAPDRIDSRMKRKVGKTTMYVGAAGEQRRGVTANPEPQYELDVADIQSLAPTCGPDR